tara:strand:+ start:18 stop:191 length:174 start_codon:yes stop_codon:yes gene_type:complete
LVYENKINKNNNNNMDYRVRFYQDNIYEVIDRDGCSCYQGSLSDCSAWLQLNDKGYL